MTASQARTEQTRFRRLLVQEVAEEHRLKRQLVAEQRAESRWEERATLAVDRGLHDLARQALARDSEHRSRVAFFEAELRQRQRWIQELRRLVHNPIRTTYPRAPVSSGRLEPLFAERRLAELEKEARLEQDLLELKQRLRASREEAHKA